MSREFDTRLQNLNFRSDEVLRSTRSGTASIDNLVGTTGDDVLVGFQGRDTLTGLGGNDLFVYMFVCCDYSSLIIFPDCWKPRKR